MRVAIFCETYLPFLNGVVTHIKLLKEGLEKNGHQVLIVTGDPDTKNHYLDENNVLHCPGIRSEYFYGYGLALPRSPSRMKFLRDFRPDVCHIHQEFGVGLFGLQVAHELDKPLIYTLHTMYDDYLYYIAPKVFIPEMRTVAHRYFRHFGKAATAITGPSQKSQEYIDKIGVDKTVHIIPNPVELDAFYADALSADERKGFRSTLGIPADDFLAVFVGRLGKEKSVDVLLENWAERITEEDHIHLLVIGDGPVLEDLKKQSEKLGIESQVTFTGKVAHDALLPYYAISDIYITASLSDTYSISMLEGNATGLATIQRYDELNREQVIDGENGFTFTDADSMAAALRQVRDLSQKEREELSKRVLLEIQKFGSDVLSERIVEVYKEAVSTYVPVGTTVPLKATRFKWTPPRFPFKKEDSVEESSETSASLME